MTNKKYICPDMTARTTRIDQPTKPGEVPTTTPVVVFCQNDCRLFDTEDKSCLLGRKPTKKRKS